MDFHSILFTSNEERNIVETLRAPAFFADLNLDQIVDAVTAGKQEYNLKPFFYTTLNDVNAIKYRHEVMQDLENEALFESIRSFAHKLRLMRQNLILSQKLSYKYHKEGWFLEAVDIYCDAVNCLARDLVSADLKSRGFQAFRALMADYSRSSNFDSLRDETQKLRAEFQNRCTKRLPHPITKQTMFFLKNF